MSQDYFKDWGFDQEGSCGGAKAGLHLTSPIMHCERPAQQRAGLVLQCTYQTLSVYLEIQARKFKFNSNSGLF